MNFTSLKSFSVLFADAGFAQSLNVRHSGLCALIAIVITVSMLMSYYRNKCSPRIVIAAVCLTLLHPAWTVSATRGDLGNSQRLYSIISTAMIGGLMLAMYLSEENWSNVGKGELPDDLECQERRITK